MAKKLFPRNARLKLSTLASGCLCAVLLFESCYSTTVNVGNIDPDEPLVEVNTAHNGHFIGGLVNATKVEDDVYVGDSKDYAMKTYVSVGNAVVSVLSAGLFTPTTTKFYLPYGSEMPPKVKMPPVRFGVRGGLNISSPTGDGDAWGDNGNISSTLGLKVGAIFDIPMTHSVYFQPGLYYSQTGGKFQDAKFNQNYWEIPLLLSFRFGVPNILASTTNGNSFTQNMQFQLHFGPYVGVCNNDFGTENLDYGVQIGLGGLFMNHIYIGVSYDFGFADMGGWGYSKKHEFDASFQDVYRRNFSIVAGFNF